MPIKRILLNTLDYTDVQLYGDTVQKKLMLSFPKYGIALPGDVYTGVAEPAASGTLASTLQLTRSTTDDGEYASKLLEMSSIAPAEDTNWTYGLTIRKKVKKPGVNNAQSNLFEKTYSGQKKRITVTAGVISDADLLVAENDLITKITQDTGLYQPTNDPEIKFSGADVEASRVYKFDINAANTDVLKITKPDGTSFTVAMSSNTTLRSHLDDLHDDATFDATGIVAVAYDADTIMLLGPAGYLFTAEDGAGATTLINFKRYVALKAKSVKVQFDVKFEPETWSQYGFWFYALDGTTATTTHVWMRSIALDGTITVSPAATVAATVPNLVTELNADAGGYAYATIRDTGETTVYVVTDGLKVTDFELWWDYDSTLVLGDIPASSMGRFPSLTSDDVFRAFFNQKDGGAYGAMQYLDQPIQNADYVKYTFKVKGIEVSSLHGPSYNQSAEIEVEVYVLKSLVDDNIWDPGRGRYTYVTAPVTPATSFDGLLTIWAGVAYSSW